MKEYPQLFLSDYKGQAEIIRFDTTSKSMQQVVTAVIAGPQKTEVDLMRGTSFFSNKFRNVSKMRERFFETVKDTPSFGFILLLMNILFLYTAWKASAFVSRLVISVIFEEEQDLTLSKKSQ